MQTRILPAARGAFWLMAGFRLYRSNPPLLTMLTFVYLLLSFTVSLIQPIGQVLLPFLLPFLTVLVANGCRTIDENLRPAPLTALGHGLRSQRVSLLRLGGLHLLGTLLVVLADQWLPGGNLQAIGELKEGATITETQAEELVWYVVRLLSIALPVMLTFWFAPLLTAWDGIPALKSVFFSLVAIWRNWRAFLVYGLSLLWVGVFLPGLVLVLCSMVSASLLEIAAAALRVLLLLVLAPVAMTCTYLSYRDVFQLPAADSDADHA